MFFSFVLSLSVNNSIITGLTDTLRDNWSYLTVSVCLTILKSLAIIVNSSQTKFGAIIIVQCNYNCLIVRGTLLSSKTG